MKTLIACNILTNIQNAPYVSHINMIYRLAKKYPNDTFGTYFPYRMAIDVARDNAAKIALEQEFDYLFFYDDDAYLHPDTFQSLLEADKDVVMAQTFIRGTPFHNMAFKEVGRLNGDVLFAPYDDYLEHADSNGIVECAAVGFSTVLIKTELLKKLNPPWFVTGSGMTEDVYFCIKAKKAFPETSICIDCKVPAGHLLSPEIVSINNVEKLREFYGADLTPKAIKDNDPLEVLKWINQIQ